jgi:hypothetical protein
MHLSFAAMSLDAPDGDGALDVGAIRKTAD